MKSFLRVLLVPLALLLVAGFGPQQKPAAPPKDVHISFTEVDGVWKAVLTGTETTAVHVVKGQKVIFHAEGTDVHLQFDNATLFGGHTRSIEDGKTLTLGVGQVAKGVYVYAAFCDGPKVFAVGDSPPKIIVD